MFSTAQRASSVVGGRFLDLLKARLPLCGNFYVVASKIGCPRLQAAALAGRNARSGRAIEGECKGLYYENAHCYVSLSVVV